MQLRSLLSCAVLAVALPAMGAARPQPSHTAANIAIDGFAGFTQTATGNGMTVTTPQWYGGDVEGRLRFSPLMGFELAFSEASPENHTYTATAPLTPKQFPCTTNCTFTPPPVEIESYRQTYSFSWVPSMHVGHLEPFGVLGIGALLDVPDNGNVTVELPGSNGAAAVFNPFSTTDSVRAAYIYGAGLNLTLTQSLGIRLQYRGEMYKSPDVAPSVFPSTDTFVQTAEPMVGIYLGL